MKKPFDTTDLEEENESLSGYGELVNKAIIKENQHLKAEVEKSFRNIFEYMRAYCSMATNNEAWDNFQNIFNEEKNKLGLSTSDDVGGKE